MSSINLPIPKGWASVAAGDDFQFFSTVKPGDILTCREKLIEAYEKKGQTGNIIFTIREKMFTNQHNLPVITRRLSSAHIEQSRSQNTSARMNPPRETKIGSELPVLTIGPVMIRHLAMFAVATAEFVDIHYDRDYAQSMGLPNVLIQGLYKTALIAQMLKNWAKENDAIRWIKVQHRGMDVAGNSLTAGGRVIGTSQYHNEKLTECEVWTDNQYISEILPERRG